MSNKKLIKSTSSSSTNSTTRPRKLLPPPLCLPAETITTHEQTYDEQKKPTNVCFCCSSSSSNECSHELIPYILPIKQRPQILETLINSSSRLLIPPLSETKIKKSQNSNRMKQCQAIKPSSVVDDEWIDLIRLIICKPLENEIKTLLDKYKMNYFDRVNAPNTTDATIRTCLCDIVSQTLATYSTSSSTSSITTTTDNAIPISSSDITTTSNIKRKRESADIDISESSSDIINHDTKFVISYIIPGKCNKYQHEIKQFQKKYSHLFKYVPDENEQSYLIRKGYLENNSDNNNICLMLYDEILTYMNEYDLELSGISIDNSFTLSESILKHIQSCTQ
ncbi:unnamed protein product [Adineta steineri]|uniref:Uncharacterized protein n=1 Tax=Adineta steineri TaxID=433720 RepID=A0A813X1F6_9BILA|nr:unnamed protein product [Adineta steineri]CAF3693325.1 unnamed protein product [Adineta steineri]